MDSQLKTIISQAEKIAHLAQEELSSAHLLLALFTSPNPTQHIFRELGFSENDIIRHAAIIPKEPAGTLNALLSQADSNALQMGNDEPGVMHVLLAMLRTHRSDAYRLLEEVVDDLDGLRSRVLLEFSKQPNQLNITILPKPARSTFELDANRFPWLTNLGRNLTALADRKQLDPCIGREREIEQIIDVLGKRRANNPCLVGDPGVGKTAIVEGLAVKMANKDPMVAPLFGKALIELDMGRILAGTSLRGSFSERMLGLKQDVEEAHGKVIVFIDEIHNLMGADSDADGAQDAANDLKSALARGAFPCIGSTTFSEYRKYILSDPAFERRFVKIAVDEPSTKETTDVLRGAKTSYENHHQVKAPEEAIVACVDLASRFLCERKLPAKAIDLLDLTMSRAKRAQKAEISREDVAQMCADISKVPIEFVSLSQNQRLLDLEKNISHLVVGHEQIISKIASTIRRHSAGFTKNKPLGSFMFLGPPGVGKTTMAKAIATACYGSAQALIQLDMGEFAEGHTSSRLIGAPPGYLGHDQGGQLTDALRERPYSVVLFDNIEKAHSDIHGLLSQALDEGYITDSKGQQISVKNAVIVMTSNAGCELTSRKIGFDQTEPVEEVMASARPFFSGELWNRVEDKLVFSALSETELAQIAERILAETLKDFEKTRGFSVEIDQQLPLEIVKKLQSLKEGARPLRHLIQSLIETPLAESAVAGNLTTNVKIYSKADKFCVESA